MNRLSRSVKENIAVQGKKHIYTCMDVREDIFAWFLYLGAMRGRKADAHLAVSTF